MSRSVVFPLSQDAEHSAAGEALLFLEEKELVYGYSAKNAVTPGSDPLPSRKRPRTASGTLNTLGHLQLPSPPVLLPF